MEKVKMTIFITRLVMKYDELMIIKAVVVAADADADVNNNNLIYKLIGFQLSFIFISL